MSGDGTSMAIRAGIPVINAEFFGNERLAACGNYNPNYGDPRNTVQPAARVIDGLDAAAGDRAGRGDRHRTDPEAIGLGGDRLGQDMARVAGEGRRQRQGTSVVQRRGGGDP